MSSHDETRSRAFSGMAGRLRAAFAPNAVAEALIAGGGGFVAIFLLAWITARSEILLLIAPFGSSCVLVFALPASPLAQPRNVIGGHLVSTIAGFAVLALVGASPLGFALGVALAIAGMMLTRTTHPPAGADPIVVLMTAAGWSFLFTPMLVGAAAIVLVGIAYHRLVSRKTYPAN